MRSTVLHHFPSLPIFFPSLLLLSCLPSQNKQTYARLPSPCFGHLKCPFPFQPLSQSLLRSSLSNGKSSMKPFLVILSTWSLSLPVGFKGPLLTPRSLHLTRLPDPITCAHLEFYLIIFVFLQHLRDQHLTQMSWAVSNAHFSNK